MAGTTEEALLIHERTNARGGSGVDSTVIKRVLSYFFRCEGLKDIGGNFIELNHLLVDRVSEETSTSKSAVIRVISLFLGGANDFHQLLKSEFVAWTPGKNHRRRKVRFFLRKAHRIAPVFNYSRAQRNLGLLHLLLERKNFWPHITTQLAMVIFVTDRNDPTCIDKNYILQKNLRALCSCSAYAFHMARNKFLFQLLSHLNP